MNNTYGSIRPSLVDVSNDVEIFYHYRPTRNSEDEIFSNFKKVENEHLLTGDIVIGENVWIGSNVVILRNTTIGDTSVIAAGSVVIKDCKANTMYAGVPAKEIKNLY